MRTLLYSSILLLAGCGSEPASAPAPEARAAFVGTLDGTDARVGLVREGAHVALFVCGGPTSMSATRWFRGDVRADGALALTSGDATVTASSSESAWSGTFTWASEPARSFRVRAARAGTAEDLYEGLLDGGSVGVIVTDETMQGVFKAVDGSTFQVLPVRTVERTAQGLAVKVNLASGPRELFVLPARAL